MENIHEARKLYIEYTTRKLFHQEPQKSKMKNNIQQLFTLAIRQLPSSILFENIWMLEILKSALKQTVDEGLNVQALERAFKGLEKYFLHLVQQPWKKEFREIKMYGGFYRTMVKAVIPDCEQIFERAGYMVIPEKNTMIYKGPMNKLFLLLLALDCKMGQIECKVIAEHYSVVKDLSLTLYDVISRILNDEYSLDKFAFSHNLAQRRGLAGDALENFNASAPPVIPKRVPIIDGSVLRQNVKSVNVAYNPSDDHRPDLVDMKWKTGLSNIKNPPQWSTDLSPYYLPKPPLSSGMRPDSLAYLDNITDEQIPELPQGTLEDHMLETLKLVNKRALLRQKISEDCKLDIKNISGINHSQFLTASPLAARGSHSGNTMSKSFQNVSFTDEGIDLEMPASKCFSFSSKFGSAGVQQVLPTKHAYNIYQPPSDPGYGTGNQPSISNQFLPSQMYNVPQNTIYHPPSTQPNLSEKAPPSRQNNALARYQQEH